MASISKRGNNWQARIYYTDKEGHPHNRTKGGFKSKKEAELFAAEITTKIHEGFAPGEKRESHVFADYFWKWFEDFKEAKLSERTKNRYAITHRELKKYFGQKKIEYITRRNYQRFINDYGSNHAKDTVQKVNSLVHACVKNAVYEEVIAKDFCEGVELSYDKSRTHKIDYLNIDEIKRVTAHLMKLCNVDFTSNQMLLTATFTGMRKGEIQGLQWDDINFNFKTISVRRSWDDVKKREIPTKNDSSKRTVRINSDLVDILKSMPHRDKHVFVNQYGSIPTSTALNKQLRSVLDDLNINRSGFHFHSLRHTHVAFLLANGVDLYAISKRLGHSDLGTTTRIYSYLIDEYKVKTDDSIENELDKLSAQVLRKSVQETNAF